MDLTIVNFNNYKKAIKIQNDEAWLAWFGILPKYQHKGYGKKLLEKTINLAQKQGYKTLRLYTDKSDKIIKIYNKISQNLK